MTAGQAGYHEAIRLARETGQRTELAAGLAALAWLEARQGREEACRGHAAEARALCASLGIGPTRSERSRRWAISSSASCRAQAALDHLEEQRARLEALGIVDVDLSPAAELVDPYLRVGRSDEAAATTETFATQARAKGQPWSLARLARCRGPLAPDDGFERHFDEALRRHELTPDLFEKARTRLAFGSRLRRARQRVRAREELRTAPELFDRLGAAPRAELTHVELQATGKTARRRDASTLDTLTPQELQLALLLADGKTIRETAAALFLSPKAIEYHLRHVYRKLDIGSRTELAGALRSA